MIGFFALVSKTLPSFAQCPAITYPKIFRVLHNIQPELVRKSSKFCTVAKQYLSKNIPSIAQCLTSTYPKIFRVLRNVQPILVKKSSEYCTMSNQYLSKKSSEYCTMSNHTCPKIFSDKYWLDIVQYSELTTCSPIVKSLRQKKFRSYNSTGSLHT